MTAKRNYKLANIKLLCSKSGNKCAYPDCNSILCDKNNTNIGEIAHIYPLGVNEARYSPDIEPSFLNSCENLLILCRNCHARIDDKKLEHIHTVAWLFELKKVHEDIYSKACIPESYFTIMVDQLVNQLAEKLNEAFTLISTDPRLKTHFLQKVEGSDKYHERNKVKKLATYCILALIISALGALIFLSAGYFSFLKGIDYNPYYSAVILFIGVGLYTFLALKNSWFYFKLFLWAKKDKEVLIDGWYVILNGDKYHLYKKSFTCGFPGCEGYVDIRRKEEFWFDISAQIKGTCRNNSDHTFRIKRDKAAYHDFMKDQMVRLLQKNRR